jgi:hypothetical protein
MDDIRIDRLSLKLSGLTEPQGRHLAMLITQGLAAARVSPNVAGDQPAIRADVTNSEVGDLHQLSGRVVAELLRQIESSL